MAARRNANEHKHLIDLNNDHGDYDSQRIKPEPSMDGLMRFEHFQSGSTATQTEVQEPSTISTAQAYVDSYKNLYF